MTHRMDIDQLRRWIGRQETSSELVTEAMVGRFKATFDLEGATMNGEAAPVMIHLCVAPPAAPTAGLGVDGHPARGGFLPPVPLPRRMWAGGAFKFEGDIRVGDLVARHSTIRDVTLKEGRTGPLCFVIVDHRVESGGRLVIEERQDIVYRGIDTPGGGTRKAPEPAPHGAHRMLVAPSAPLLFRYSALTFNSHRVHYDVPYLEEEAYPGRVVHGPLQATQLVRFAEQVRGARPKRFDFRSLSPLFDIADYTLNAVEEEGGLRLWTSYADGPVAMEALAAW